MLTKPNYKDHLRQMIQAGNNSDDSDLADDTISGASILSSHDPSAEEAQSGLGESSSFLSVTPSMLNSSVFEQHERSVSSIGSMTDEEDGNNNDYNVPASLLWNGGSVDDISTVETTEVDAVIVSDEESSDSDSVNPTVGAVAEPILGQEEEQKDPSLSSSSSSTDRINSSNDDVPSHAQTSNAGEATVMGSILQAGSIAVGVVGIVLMLATAGGSGGACRKEGDKHSNKKKRRDHRACKRDLHRSRCRGTRHGHPSFLFSDW